MRAPGVYMCSFSSLLTPQQGSKTNILYFRLIKINYGSISANQQVSKVLTQYSPLGGRPSWWVAAWGACDGSLVARSVCWLQVHLLLPSHPLPNSPSSFNTAVEDNSISYIFIDDLNKGNINNITDLLENSKIT